MDMFTKYKKWIKTTVIIALMLFLYKACITVTEGLSRKTLGPLISPSMSKSIEHGWFLGEYDWYYKMSDSIPIDSIIEIKSVFMERIGRYLNHRDTIVVPIDSAFQLVVIGILKDTSVVFPNLLYNCNCNGNKRKIRMIKQFHAQYPDTVRTYAVSAMSSHFDADYQDYLHNINEDFEGYKPPTDERIIGILEFVKRKLF